MILPTVRLVRGRVELIDQTLLPGEYRIISLATVDGVCEAITRLRVRGAPALGVAGAYGLVVSVEERWGGDGHIVDASTGSNDSGQAHLEGLPPSVSIDEVRAVLRDAARRLGATRPTAVNLAWAIRRMEGVYESVHADARALVAALVIEAVEIHREDVAMCLRLGNNGAELLNDGDAVLTHCNTGGLATGGFGTALGVVFAAVESGKRIHVFADETRPLLQGARLTAWECERARVPVTVLVDGAAASLMAAGRVACAIVGADRIAANGDTANKIGTLGVALAARRFGVPFYVAAPSSTIDRALAVGSLIPIEERSPDEVRGFSGVVAAPVSVGAYNPAFDVTPQDLITAIITEAGVHTPPFDFRK
jgi:methylthioribose-1-phosphate isomerase